MVDQFNLSWFVIRVTYSQEMKLKLRLDALGIENFVPMHYVEQMEGDRRVKKLVPAIHNLIFVKSCRHQLDEIKSQIAYMRYLIDKSTNAPMVVPTRQMNSFMTIACSMDERVCYIEQPDLNLTKGDRVRIVSGLFEGAEGVYLRIKGDRRVVVAIDNFIAVATAFVHPSMVEPIEK